MLRTLLIAIGTAITLVTLTPPSSATPTQGTEATGPVKHCVTVIEKLKPGERESRIVERTCTTDVQVAEATKARMSSFRSLLVQYFEHPDWKGASDSIYGWGSSCDASGYGIPNTAPFENRISSWYTYGTCDHTIAWVNTRYGGESVSFPGQSVAYPRRKDAYGNWTGTDMNDIVRSMWLKDA